jgi:tetratricopeptide (TPR) repeat protein
MSGVREEPFSDPFDAVLRELARTPERSPELQSVMHYRILGKVGEGGMGAVYKAEDTKLRRTVAIKRIAASNGASESRERLLREARAASALNHPSIVTIYAIEQTEDVDFIVMEFVEGEPLSVLIAGRRIPLPVVLDVGADVADALACAHAAGLVHRDIKPANIIVTPHGRAKVLDFGVAKFSQQVVDEHAPTTSAPLTAAGVVVGTLPYMSPEQVQGTPLDGRSDQFALGSTLYEALTGRRAFPGNEALAVARGIATVDPPPPSSVEPAIPPAVDAIVMRALAKSPSLRFDSCREMALALREPTRGALGGTSIRSPEPERVLVGRERDLGELQDLLSRAMAGTGTLGVVTGEAGVGKTALLESLLRHASRLLPAPIVGVGRAIEQFGQGEAYLPFFDAFSDLLSGPHGALAREIVNAAAPTWALHLPMGNSTGAVQGLRRESIGATKERMVRELGDAVAALSARVPVLLVLEDLHWADASSADALRHLSNRITRTRACAIVTARDSEVDAANHPLRGMLAEWRAKRSAVELKLRALSIPEVRGWLDTRFSPNDFDDSLARAVAARTEGHPLYVASMLDFLVGDGRVVRDASGWHATTVDPRSLSVPANLRDMLRAKLDSLPPEVREMLEVASVQGDDFVSTIVGDLLGMDDVGIEEHLARAAKSTRLLALIGEEDLPDGTLATRWRFAHVLYRDVLYEEMLPRRRAVLHRQAGNALVARHGAGAPKLASTLAVHFELGRDFGRATAELQRAGDNAMHVFAGVEAHGYYTRALACAERVDARDRERTAAVIHRLRALARTAMGRYDAAIADLEQALSRAQAAANEELVGVSRVALAEALIAAHRLDQAVPHARAALSIAEARGDAALRNDALANLALERLLVGELEECARSLDGIQPPGPLVMHMRGLLHYLGSDYEASERELTNAAEVNERELGDGLLLMESQMFRALAVANRGRLHEARILLEETLVLAQRNDSAVMLARAGNSLGWVLREMGQLEAAEEQDARSAETGRATEETEAEANALVNLGEDAIARGDVSGVSAVLERVKEIGAADAWMRFRYTLRRETTRARALVARGEWDEAIAAAAVVRDAAAKQRAGKYLCMAEEIEARALLAKADLEAAGRAIERARDLLAVKPSPLVAWRIEALARVVAQRSGDASGAEEARHRTIAQIQRLTEAMTPDERVRFLASPEVARACAEV